jgi:citrate lyase subunit beta/citryl-CoA lyase
VDVINLPKVESCEDVIRAAEAISRPIGLLATIETPKGLRLAHEIARAHPSMVGLQIGYADLFSLCGIDRRDTAAVQTVRLTVRFAAAEASIDAYDGAFLSVQDQAGFRAEAEAARRHGFAGKSCIHPSQIAIANEVFSPSALEVGQAEKLLTAAGEAAERGVGAFVLDGRMVDAPVIAHAQAIVNLAARIDRGDSKNA